MRILRIRNSITYAQATYTKRLTLYHFKALKFTTSMKMLMTDFFYFLFSTLAI